MGCDIHLQVERRVNGEWFRVPHPTRECERCEGTGKVPDTVPNEKMRGGECWSCKGRGETTEEFFDDRNYDVFAILANVRNGYGFAGVDTGDGFVPIDEPRDLPDDLSLEIRGVFDNTHFWCDRCKEYRTEKTTIRVTYDHGEGRKGAYDAEACFICEHEVDRHDWNNTQNFWLGDHSWSWLTVEEILEYDWTRTTKKRGWVGVSGFEEFERDGQPSSYSGGVSGQGVYHVSNQEMRRRIDDGSARRSSDAFGDILTRDPSYFTLVEWESPYTEPAAHFLQILNRDIVPLGDPADVRLVFGFDS